MSSPLLAIGTAPHALATKQQHQQWLVLTVVVSNGSFFQCLLTFMAKVGSLWCTPGSSGDSTAFHWPSGFLCLFKTATRKDLLPATRLTAGEQFSTDSLLWYDILHPTFTREVRSVLIAVVSESITTTAIVTDFVATAKVPKNCVLNMITRRYHSQDRTSGRKTPFRSLEKKSCRSWLLFDTLNYWHCIKAAISRNVFFYWAPHLPPLFCWKRQLP